MKVLCLLLALGFSTPVIAQESQPSSVLEARVQELEKLVAKLRTEKPQPTEEEQEKQIVAAIKRMEDRAESACKRAGMKVDAVGPTSFMCKR